jgi:hypothetical protein
MVEDAFSIDKMAVILLPVVCLLRSGLSLTVHHCISFRSNRLFVDILASNATALDPILSRLDQEV